MIISEQKKPPSVNFRKCLQHCGKWKEKLKWTVGNRHKSVFLVEVRCIQVFGIDKQTNETGLLSDQPPWVVFAIVSYGACWFSPRIWLYLCFYICIGALLHLGEDYLSITGIPFRSPSGPPRGAKLYSTGTATETIIVLSITVPLVGFIWMRGFLTLGHLMEEMKKTYSLIALFWR